MCFCDEYMPISPDSWKFASKLGHLLDEFKVDKNLLNLKKEIDNITIEFKNSFVKFKNLILKLNLFDIFINILYKELLMNILLQIQKAKLMYLI